jgi:hypothetical protein
MLRNPLASNLPIECVPEGIMTNFTKLITPTAVLAAFTLAAAPALAQEKYHGRSNPSGQQQGQQQSGNRGGERAQPRSEAPRAQPQAERPQAGAAPRVETRQQTPRAQQPRPAETPRAQQPRAVETPRAENRGNEQRRGEVGRAVPRRDATGPRDRVYAPRYSPRYSPRVYSPRVYGPRSYYRPYVFRPRYSIGFGIFAGYPVPYTYTYSYPVPVYGYGAPRNEVLITPGASAYGGVALEITPFDADVWVDGEYAGKVEDFDGTTQPLTLTPGTHRIEVQAPGYEPMTVDVGVQPGQVIPYRGDLRPL